MELVSEMGQVGGCSRHAPLNTIIDLNTPLNPSRHAQQCHLEILKKTLKIPGLAAAALGAFFFASLVPVRAKLDSRFRLIGFPPWKKNDSCAWIIRIYTPQRISRLLLPCPDGSDFADRPAWHLPRSFRNMLYFAKWLMIPDERVLLLEDDARIARFVGKGLREQSYAVDLATNGDDALYQAEINSYDLFILDVMIPSPDGFTVCRKLR
jgi:CheY-like chemotaxis protein